MLQEVAAPPVLPGVTGAIGVPAVKTRAVLVSPGTGGGLRTVTVAVAVRLPSELVAVRV